MNKPFTTKQALITCSCKNNGFIVTEYYGVLLAKLSLHCTKQHLFNENWIRQFKAGILDDLDEKQKLLAEHLKLGHKLKVVPVG